MARPATLGELKSSGYEVVEREGRDAAQPRSAMLARTETTLPRHHRLRRDRVPQLVNAMLSQHDFLLLGLRGQAKTRILRSLATSWTRRSP